ncbi:MAG: MBL fold metallo-hydrolase [Chloroflexales bacterium]|nr:MBL fold metallo-hydrolase [Chloroflexales bacterium]
MALHISILGAPGGDNALFVSVNRGQRIHRLLLDCGEVGLTALPLADVRGLDHLLLSHLHMDHIGGFDSLFRQTFSRGVDAPVHVWGPPETARIIHHRLCGFMWNLTEQLRGTWVVHDVGPERVVTTRYEAAEGFAVAHPAGETPRAGAIIATDDYTVAALDLDHGTPCLGYLLREPPRRNVDPARLAALGLAPGPWLGAVRTPRPGEPSTVEIEGKARSLAELRAALITEAPGASLAYLTDFRLDAGELARLAEALGGVDTLVCEAQYRTANADLATRACHLTTAQAGALAATCGAGELVLIHISERYGRAELPAILAEARAVFPRARLPEAWTADQP